jgi:hypothetical protein
LRTRWFWVSVLGALILGVGGILIALLISVWTAVEQATSTPTPKTVSAELLGFASISVTPGTAILILVVFAASVGSFIHIATSFADFVGNERFRASWVWWYLLRVLIGTGLALLFYFAFRGGFFSDTSTSEINPYGIAAISGLAGLFSKQATDKLDEVFTTLFRAAPGKGDAQRQDSLVAAAPKIAKLDPKALAVGAGDTNVKVKGTGFTSRSKVQVKRDGTVSERAAEFVDATSLSFDLTADDLRTAGTILVTVVNLDADGGRSNEVPLTVK